MSFSQWLTMNRKSKHEYCSVPDLLILRRVNKETTLTFPFNFPSGGGGEAKLANLNEDTRLIRVVTKNFWVDA